MKELHWDMVGCNGENVGEEFLENFIFLFFESGKNEWFELFFFNK